ncbi:hypothetical protein BBJ28_00015236 [Nothophytophthora sp. Chile5]|nr:hypothetical protein BBJ28_00015236 [Nothophytophthora sp. Chile5]
MLVLFKGVEAQTATESETTMCGLRVRRAWGVLSSADKELYRDAINAAMTQGYHVLFMEVLSNRPSFTEAERTSGMLFWHRRFLLAYENMLRSLEPRFACLTIPYWDFFADYAKAVSGVCSSFQDCSQFLQEFGGSNGSQSNHTFGDDSLSANGSCVDGSGSPYGDFSSFCQSSETRPESCWGCIPRGSWLDTRFPSGLGYASLASLVSLPFGFSWFSSNLHFGMLTAIHNAADGAMITYDTAADPLFYNLHATVDLVHQLYYDCQVGRVLTDVEKQTSPSEFVYQTYVMAPATSAPSLLSNMTMVWNASSSGGPVRVDDHPRLAPFFSELPPEYWHYVSGRDLGTANSYRYEADSLFKLLQEAGLTEYCNVSGDVKASLELKSVELPPVDDRTKVVAKSFNLFIDLLNTTLASEASLGAALEQGELMDCMWHGKKLGVEDLSPSYRRNVDLPSDLHTLCHQRVEQVETGMKTIHFSGWEDMYTRHMTMETTELTRKTHASCAET